LLRERCRCDINPEWTHDCLHGDANLRGLLQLAVARKVDPRRMPENWPFEQGERCPLESGTPAFATPAIQRAVRTYDIRDLRCPGTPRGDKRRECEEAVDVNDIVLTNVRHQPTQQRQRHMVELSLPPKVTYRGAVMHDFSHAGSS